MQNPLWKGIAAFVVVAGSLMAQPPAPAPQFEVATIKPSPPLDPSKIMAGKLHIGMSIDAARVDIGFMSLSDLIQTAYRVKRYQVSGPDWISGQRFDILAKMPDGATRDQVPEMLQALLAERFNLKIHRENREQPVYALVVGKNGPKLKEATPEPAPPAAGGDAPGEPPGRGGMVVGSGENQMRINRNPDGKGATIFNRKSGPVKFSMGEGGQMHLEFAKMSMPSLAEMLAGLADRPVLDMTELKGNYEVALNLAMEDFAHAARASGIMGMMMGGPPSGGAETSRTPGDAASTPSSSSIFSAMQQLGLRLDARKVPLETIVIDHIEKSPTEN